MVKALSINRLFRRLWMYLNLRGIRLGRYAYLKRLYLIRDPWHMQSGKEQHRFNRINEIIIERFGKLDSVLEIGCGEGHQTEYLKNICQEIYGIDVSDLAVRRAKKRFPEAHLFVNDLLSYSGKPDGKRFDLVVASEVLYYIHDLPAAIKKLNSLGRHCLISYYELEIERLDSYLNDLPVDYESKVLSYEGASWKVVCWTNS